jgi:hypothetical protein
MIGLGWFSYSSEHSTGNVSIKTMFDEAFLSKLKTPKYVWLENGKALLLDFRVEPKKRTFEIFDPRNGRRESILVERHLYRVKLNGKGLERISEGDGVHAVEFSPGMNYYLDTYSNFSQPSI